MTDAQADALRLSLATTARNQIIKALPADPRTLKVDKRTQQARNLAAQAFFIGALNALELVNPGDGNTISGLAFLVSVRGFEELEDFVIREQAVAQEAAEVAA